MRKSKICFKYRKGRGQGPFKEGCQTKKSHSAYFQLKVANFQAKYSKDVGAGAYFFGANFCQELLIFENKRQRPTCWQLWFPQ